MPYYKGILYEKSLCIQEWSGQMRLVNKITIFISILCSFLFLSNLQTFASDEENMAFSIDTIAPKNQKNHEVTYFDFLVKPSEKQKLELIVANTGKKAKKIRIAPTNATTNDNGLIDYSEKEADYINDNSLKSPFTSLVSEPQIVDVKPGESKTVSFDFTAPDKEFDGIILGGFVASLVNQEDTQATNSGVSFVNKFQFVKAVIVRSSDKNIKPIIKASDVKASLVNYNTAVTVNIQNASPLLLGNVYVTADISKKGSSTIIKSNQRNNIEMAPNSNFNYPIKWDDEPLKPGDYHLTLHVLANETEFVFEEEFKISKNQSNSINKEAIDLKTNETNIPRLLVLLFVLLLIISTLSIFLYKQRKKSKQLSYDMKKKRKQSIKKFIKENKKESK